MFQSKWGIGYFRNIHCVSRLHLIKFFLIEYTHNRTSIRPNLHTDLDLAVQIDHIKVHQGEYLHRHKRLAGVPVHQHFGVRVQGTAVDTETRKRERRQQQSLNKKNKYSVSLLHTACVTKLMCLLSWLIVPFVFRDLHWNKFDLNLVASNCE